MSVRSVQDTPELRHTIGGIRNALEQPAGRLDLDWRPLAEDYVALWEWAQALKEQHAHAVRLIETWKNAPSSTTMADLMGKGGKKQ